MKKLIFILSISIVSCQSRSDCFGGRIIVSESKTSVKYEKWIEPLFKDSNGKKYVACNFPDTLTKNQNYVARLKLLKTEPNEKWVGHPCVIADLNIEKNQNFESLKQGQKSLYTGGEGKTDKDETITNGIYITKVSQSEIKYEFTQLINWKQSRELNGSAIFQSSNDEIITTRNGEIESAFRFIDLENDIEIFITKEFEINQTKSRIRENKTGKESGLMYNK